MSRPLPITLLILALTGTLNAVDFQKDILPLVKEHCWKCHSNEEVAKGGLAFDDLESLGKSQIGEHSIIRPGDPAGSDLIERLKLDSKEEDFMPKNGDALRGRELALFEQWITEGAIIDAGKPTAAELARAGEVKIANARAGGEVYFQWTNLEGKAIEARFAGVEGDAVKIMMTNGRSFVVPLKSLNEESVALAKKLAGK
jgi:hypothetical protein